MPGQRADSSSVFFSLPTGGLLSAHMLASDEATGFAVPGYADGLLHLATDLGRRLLPAFDTPTGVPFGAVNLRYGVAEGESKMTSTAGACEFLGISAPPPAAVVGRQRPAAVGDGAW